MSAKKLLDLYYNRRGEETPRNVLGDDGYPIDPELEIQEERLRATKIDHDQFEFFVAYYYHRLYRYLFNRTRRRVVAEDLTAQTVFKAQRSIRRYRWTGVTMKSWFFRIATNELLGWIKKEQKENRTPLPENILGEDMLLDPNPDPEAKLLAAEERVRLDRYISRLSPEEQVYLELRYREGMSTRQIAEIMGRPWGTVAAIVNRAINKLCRMAEDDQKHN